MALFFVPSASRRIEIVIIDVNNMGYWKYADFTRSEVCTWKYMIESFKDLNEVGNYFSEYSIFVWYSWNLRSVAT